MTYESTSALASRYRGADTRSLAFRKLVIEDIAATSSASEWVALVKEATRRGFPPEGARAALEMLAAYD